MVFVRAARPLVARRSALAAGAVVAGAVVLAACGAGRHTAVPTTVTTGRPKSVTSASPATAASTTTTTASAATTTRAARTATSRTATVPLPPDPQPTAEGAADLFMQSWIDGNRAGSVSVAVRSAVAALYARPYANQPLNDRGCTTAFQPLICTWGPYGGGSGSIYQISVSAVGSRWYVSAVTIES